MGLIVEDATTHKGMMNGIRYIQFYPTLRCNLNCHFCFNKGLPATGDVKIQDFEKIVSVLEQSGIGCVDILGGEPTLHPGLIQLIDILKRYRMKSNISSNGTNTRLLNSLSERYDGESLRIGISVNSNELPGDLHEYIIRHRPILKSVWTAKTMIHGSCEKYIGLPGIEYFLLYMDTVDSHDLKSSMPFYDFYRELVRLKKVYPGLDGVYCSGFVPGKADCSVTQSVRCPAGTAKLSISPDGSVYPCYLFFRYKEFELGNILTDDFHKICKNPILNYFRTFNGNTCPRTECMLFASCRGGCPAVSYVFFKDLDAPDPRCRDKNGHPA
ncbi:MAG: radical SAM/SPASM domain-containing protein [Pseudomonadota bacterium]